MRVLLDTHTFPVVGPRRGARLSRRAAAILERSAPMRCSVSAASACELAVKAGAGPPRPAGACRALRPEPPATATASSRCPIEFAHAFRAGDAPDASTAIRSTGCSSRRPRSRAADPHRRSGDLALRRRDDLVTPPADASLARPKPKRPQAALLGPRSDLGEAARALPAGARSVRPRRARRASTADPTWERRLDPTSELILTILTQNSADTNAEVAFEALRAAYPSGGAGRARTTRAPAGAASGCRTARRRTGRAVEFAPLPELVDTIRPGGLANQKAPRIQATLRTDPRGARRLLARVPRRDVGRSRRATG